MKKAITFIVTIFCCVLITGIGYASVSNIQLELDGTASLPGQRGIYISSITLDSTTHADSSSQIINTYYQTLLNTKTVLGEDNDSQVTYEITIKNNTSSKQEFQGVTYDPSFYSNSEIGYILSNLSVGDILEVGESRTFQITFRYNDENHSNNILDSIINFDFALAEDSFAFEMNGSCVFHGRNNDVTGDCVEPDEHVDYINKGFSLFTEETARRDFFLEVDLGEIDDSIFHQGKGDTIFSNMNEDEDTDLYPGIVFRMEDSKWYFQAGNGGNDKAKISFPKGEFTRFKVIRDNGLLYYQLDDNYPVLALDMSNFQMYFDSPLVFGASIYPDGTTRNDRFFEGELTHYKFAFEEQNVVPRNYAMVDQEIADFIGVPLTTVYSKSGPHAFDGTADTCFSTGVPLFSTTNYQKSWVATLEIDEYVHGDQINQATLFDAKNEIANGYPGVVFRKNNGKLEISIKDGLGASATVNLPLSVKRVNIIKKGTDYYYQYDLGGILSIGSLPNFNTSKCFDTEATFGSIINNQNAYDRVIVGTLSNMTIKLQE